jgi:hypothetical protein
MPPKGIIRLYKKDSGGLQFIGEDRIDHTCTAAAPASDKTKLF